MPRIKDYCRKRDTLQPVEVTFHEMGDIPLVGPAGACDFATMPPVQRMRFWRSVNSRSRLWRDCQERELTLVAKGCVRIWPVEWMVGKLVKKEEEKAQLRRWVIDELMARYGRLIRGTRHLGLLTCRSRAEYFVHATFEVRGDVQEWRKCLPSGTDRARDSQRGGKTQAPRPVSLSCDSLIRTTPDVHTKRGEHYRNTDIPAAAIGLVSCGRHGEKVAGWKVAAGISNCSCYTQGAQQMRLRSEQVF